MLAGTDIAEEDDEAGPIVGTGLHKVEVDLNRYQATVLGTVDALEAGAPGLAQIGRDTFECVLVEIRIDIGHDHRQHLGPCVTEHLAGIFVHVQESARVGIDPVDGDAHAVHGELCFAQ